MRWLARFGWIPLAVYSVLLLVALLSPSSGHQSGLVSWLDMRLVGLGLSPRLVTFQRMEVVMNAAIVAPVSFLGSLWRPSYSWRDWTAFGFAVAMAVEIIQSLLLPERLGSFSDVVANTVGALLGAVLGALLIRAATLVSGRSSRIA